MIGLPIPTSDKWSLLTSFTFDKSNFTYATDTQYRYLKKLSSSIKSAMYNAKEIYARVYVTNSDSSAYYHAWNLAELRVFPDFFSTTSGDKRLIFYNAVKNYLDDIIFEEYSGTLNFIQYISATSYPSLSSTSVYTVEIYTR